MSTQNEDRRTVVPISERDVWYVDKECGDDGDWCVFGPYRAAAVSLLSEDPEEESPPEPWMRTEETPEDHYILLFTDGVKYRSVFWAPSCLCYFTKVSADKCCEQMNVYSEQQ